MKTWIRFGAILALMIGACSLTALAQGCALCYTQAASSGARMIQALRSGILVLVLPPTLMSVGVAAVAYRRRNQFRETDSEEQETRDRLYTSYDD